MKPTITVPKNPNDKSIIIILEVTECLIKCPIRSIIATKKPKNNEFRLINFISYFKLSDQAAIFLICHITVAAMFRAGLRGASLSHVKKLDTGTEARKPLKPA